VKTIALVDWNWMGHHPTYYRKFIEAWHRLGYTVLPVCPKAALSEVEAWRHAWNGGSTVHVPIAARAPRMRQSILPIFLRGPEQAVTCFGRLDRQLRTWEKQNGTRIDLVFFSTIYDSNFSHFKCAERFFHYPWSGVYLHARAFRMPGSALPYSDLVPRPELVFTAKNMSSICLLDEGAVEHMRQLAPGKPVFEFPDITETSLSKGGNSLTEKILRIANGRKIISCLGALQKTKGLLELCMAIQSPELSDLFFFFGGEPYWGGTTEVEQALIRTVWEEAPNVITYLQRIDDRVMNDLINASDLVFAAYTDFPNSSNVMTKAAFFQKPLVVSDGYLMAERVRKHRLGRIVPEGSVTDIIQQIRHLCDHGGDPAADYQGYYAKHSPEALTTAFSKVITANN
jgi:hypothetical protein